MTFAAFLLKIVLKQMVRKALNFCSKHVLERRGNDCRHLATRGQRLLFRSGPAGDKD
jgi:hypothetical protein